MVMVITTDVAPINSAFVGQDTLVNCSFTSLINLIGFSDNFIPFYTDAYRAVRETVSALFGKLYPGTVSFSSLGHFPVQVGKRLYIHS